MVTGPTDQQFSPEFQKEIDDAVEHIERELVNLAPDVQGRIRFTMKEPASESLRGVLTRIYEGAGWKQVEFNTMWDKNDVRSDDITLTARMKSLKARETEKKNHPRASAPPQKP